MTVTAEVTTSRDLEDALMDEYVELLSGLSDVRVKAFVHARVSSSQERRTFEAASADVSRAALIFLASGYLVRQKLKAAAVTSDLFPIAFRA